VNTSLMAIHSETFASSNHSTRDIKCIITLRVYKKGPKGSENSNPRTEQRISKSGMNEDEKRRFDSLHALSEQSWRDWDHKSRGEWRFSFGIWGALLAAATATAKSEIAVPLNAVIVVDAFVVAAHITFLVWIHGTLTQYRNQMLTCRNEMEKMLAVFQDQKKKPRGPWIKQSSLWVQFSITVVLALVLVLMSLRSTGSLAPNFKVW